MIRKNNVKMKLLAGETVIGTFTKFADPSSIEILGMTDFDFVVLDNEHVAMNPENMVNICRTADISGIVPIVRVRVNQPVDIMQALDSGALGVQIPNVDTFEQAKLASESARYAPKGNRGFAPTHRAAGYGLMDKATYIQMANSDILTVIHCETIESVNNLDKILQIEDIDVIFIGPMDLSQSLGAEVMGNRSHPLLVTTIDKIIEQVVQSGKIVGTVAGDLEMAKDLMQKGCRYIAISSDQDMVAQSAKRISNELRKIIGQL